MCIPKYSQNFVLSSLYQFPLQNQDAGSHRIIQRCGLCCCLLSFLFQTSTQLSDTKLSLASKLPWARRGGRWSSDAPTLWMKSLIQIWICHESWKKIWDSASPSHESCRKDIQKKTICHSAAPSSEHVLSSVLCCFLQTSEMVLLAVPGGWFYDPKFYGAKHVFMTLNVQGLSPSKSNCQNSVKWWDLRWPFWLPITISCIINFQD